MRNVLAYAERVFRVVVDGQSTAAVAVIHLQAKRRNVVVTNGGELARACIGLTDDVLSGNLSYADSPNEDLSRAVDGARRRSVGDAGGYAWDRRDAAVAISPLVAASLAHHGAVCHGRRQSSRITRPHVTRS